MKGIIYYDDTEPGLPKWCANDATGKPVDIGGDYTEPRHAMAAADAVAHELGCHKAEILVARDWVEAQSALVCQEHSV